ERTSGKLIRLVRTVLLPVCPQRLSAPPTIGGIRCCKLQALGFHDFSLQAWRTLLDEHTSPARTRGPSRPATRAVLLHRPRAKNFRSRPACKTKSTNLRPTRKYRQMDAAERRTLRIITATP